MAPNIIYCKDCKFRRKHEDWMWCQSMGQSIWYCARGRGLSTLTQSINLDDYCSSAERKTNMEATKNG